MDPVSLTTRQAIIYSALINMAIGFVLGLIPFFFGYFNKEKRLGTIAILISTLGGAVLGIFISIPATIIFTWMIVRRAKPKPEPPEPVRVVVVNEKPVEVSLSKDDSN